MTTPDRRTVEIVTTPEQTDVIVRKLVQANREIQAERDAALAREFSGTARLVEALTRRAG